MPILWSLGKEGEWRILVEHIGSGENSYSLSLASLADFLRAQSVEGDGGEARIYHGEGDKKVV